MTETIECRVKIRIVLAESKTSFVESHLSLVEELKDGVVQVLGERLADKTRTKRLHSPHLPIINVFRANTTLR